MRVAPCGSTPLNRIMSSRSFSRTGAHWNVQAYSRLEFPHPKISRNNSAFTPITQASCEAGMRSSAFLLRRMSPDGRGGPSKGPDGTRKENVEYRTRNFEPQKQGQSALRNLIFRVRYSAVQNAHFSNSARKKPIRQPRQNIRKRQTAIRGCPIPLRRGPMGRQNLPRP